MAVLSRRGFISGLSALVAAPAIVPVRALMPVWTKGPRVVRVGYLTLDGIAREAVQLFTNSNAFLRTMDSLAWDDLFEMPSGVLFPELRIRLPSDFIVRS